MTKATQTMIAAAAPQASIGRVFMGKYQRTSCNIEFADPPMARNKNAEATLTSTHNDVTRAEKKIAANRFPDAVTRKKNKDTALKSWADDSGWSPVSSRKRSGSNLYKMKVSRKNPMTLMINEMAKSMPTHRNAYLMRGFIWILCNT